MQLGLKNPLRAITAGTPFGVASVRVLLLEAEGETTSIQPAIADVVSVAKVSSQDTAWENLLLDRSFDALVCNVRSLPSQSLSLIAAVRASLTQRISRLAIFAIEPTVDAGSNGETDWIKLGANGHFAGGGAIESLRFALHSPQGAAVVAAQISSNQGPAVDVASRLSVVGINADLAVAQVPIKNISAQPSQAVLDWLKNRFNANDGWLILHGALEQRVSGEIGPRRPSRLAMLQQHLRKGDELLVEDERLFWVAVRVGDELLGARLAVRIALKLMRSSDPGRFPIAVAIAGCCLSENPETAVEMCRRNLPAINQAGDVSIAIDRWRFSLPIRVAQTLLLG